MRFHVSIRQTGKTTTGIEVPVEVVEHLGGGKHPKVQVTIKGYTYPSSIASMGRVFIIPVRADVRANTGVAGGDENDVDVELDTAPREVSIPPDFAAALDGDADAKQCLEGLSYSNQRRHILSVEGAKTSETRQRRIDKAIHSLREDSG